MNLYKSLILLASVVFLAGSSPAHAEVSGLRYINTGTALLEGMTSCGFNCVSYAGSAVKPEFFFNTPSPAGSYSILFGSPFEIGTSQGEKIAPILLQSATRTRSTTGLFTLSEAEAVLQAAINAGQITIPSAYYTNPAQYILSVGAPINIGTIGGNTGVINQQQVTIRWYQVPGVRSALSRSTTAFPGITDEGTRRALTHLEELFGVLVAQAQPIPSATYIPSCPGCVNLPPSGPALGEYLLFTAVETQPNITAGATTNASYNPPLAQWLVAQTASTFSSVISNTGNSTASNFPNMFHMPEAGATVNAQNLTLASGGSSAVSAQFTFTTPGYYQTRSCGDFNSGWGSAISESNESDNCGPYAAFTVVPAMPANPSASCAANGVATLTWSVPPGGADSYYVRVQAPTASCPSGWQYVNWGAHICVPNPDVVYGTSVAFGSTIGQSYTMWIHGRNAGGEWGPAAYGNFTCSGVPDLTASNLSPAGGSSHTTGTSISFQGRINNSGTGTATNIPNILQVCNGVGTCTSLNTTVSAGTVSSVAAGANATVSANYTFSSAGTYSYRFCADNSTSWIGMNGESNEGNNCDGWSSLIISNPPLTADLTATPTSVISGQSALLRWSSNADSCTGTGFNTGGAANNSVGVSTGALSLANCPSGSCSYQATCTRTVAQSEGASLAEAGEPTVAGTESVFDTVTVNVITPTATITASPDRVKSGSASSITWSSSLATSCTVTGTNGFSQSALSGTNVSSGPLTTMTTFSISCDGGVATDSVIVNLVPNFEEF